jgi:hypothetical protein
MDVGVLVKPIDLTLTLIRIDQRGADHRKHPPTCKTYSTAR